MKHCRPPFRLVLASIAALNISASADKTLPPQDRKLLLSDKMTILHSKSAIPAKVKAALAALVHQPALEMADPDEPFQVGDTIMPGRKLPGRRLVFAALDDARCVVHYERGGIAHLYYVVAFSLEKGKEPVFRWGARMDSKLADVPSLREAVAAGKFHDVRDEAW